MGFIAGLVQVAVVTGITAWFVHLGRGRARIMRYHDIPTPRVIEMTHGGDGGA